MRLQFYAAGRDSYTAVATVGRDSGGDIVVARAEINPPVDPNLGEAYAAQLAVKTAAELGLPKVVCGCDL